MQKIIRNRIFLQNKCCKGEEAKSNTTSFEKKNAKLLKYGKSHEKVDLTIKGGYKYNIIKLVGYCDKRKLITERVLC